MLPPDLIFDRALVRRRLARAANRQGGDFLLARTVEDLADRLLVVQRSFTRIADLGTPTPLLARALATRWPDAQITRVAPTDTAERRTTSLPLVAVAGLEALPIAPRSFDLAVSALALQTIDDLPGALVQIRHALTPDGLFLGALVGGRSLHELRAVLTEAEVEVAGGASPRVAPFADVRDMGGLLQRAGFALPVADSEVVTVRYDHLFALMADLRAMGATNPLAARSRRPTRRAMFLRAAALYAERYADADGRIRATFEIVSVSGWGPHESQQKPARRGSAQVSLAAILGDQTGNLSKS